MKIGEGGFFSVRIISSASILSQKKKKEKGGGETTHPLSYTPSQKLIIG